MKKRALSWLLALCMLVSLAPQTIPWAKAANEDSSKSSTDAFGIQMYEWTDQEKKKAEGEAPFGSGYGTWSTILEKNELFVSMGYDRSTQRAKYYDWNDTLVGQDQIANKIKGFSQDGMSSQSASYTAVETAPMDLNNSGKKEYVATLSFTRGSKSPGTLQLYVTDTKNNVVTTRITVASSGIKQLNDLDTYELKGAFSIAAGDFDGDGKDTIIVYIPQMSGSGPYIAEYAVNGSNIEAERKSIICSNVVSLLGNSTIKESLKDQPMVSLVAEDTDKDGFDELVVTAGMNDVTTDDTHLGSRLFIYDKLTNNTWNKTYENELKVSEDNDRIVWASSTVGNMVASTGTGVDYPEILSAGFVDKDDGKHINLHGDDYIGVVGVKVTSVSSRENKFTITSNDNKKVTVNNVICSYQEMFKQRMNSNGWTRGGLYEKDDVNSLLQVQAFADRGVGEAESVFISGSVYRVSASGLTHKYNYSEFNSKDKGATSGAISQAITNTNVISVAAGNFNGNKFGQEQIIFVTALRQSGKNNTWSRVYCYYNQYDNEAETTKTDDFKGERSGYLTEHKGAFYITLNAVDPDNDSTVAYLNDVSRTYSQPDVLAILEASPYFKEIGEGDIGNSQTVYGTSTSSGSETANSFGFTVGIMVGYEHQNDLTQSGGGFETNIDNSFNWTTAKSESTEWGIEYSNDTGDNVVVVYRCPVVSYQYIDQDGKELVVSKTGEPASSMIPVEEYNEAAEQYGLDRITDENVGLADAGNPMSYRSSTTTLPNAIEADGSTAETTKNGWVQYKSSGTTTQSITKTKETAKTFDYTLDISFTAYGMIGGFKAGVNTGFSYNRSETSINGESVTKSGSVNGQNVNGYDFSWRFAAWQTKINANTIPVLGYLVQDVVAPPSPAQNLRADTITKDSITLRWDLGDRGAQQYRIYRVLGTSENPVLVGAVDGDKTEYTLKGLTAGDTYTYVVRGVGYDAVGNPNESVNSSSLTVRTQSASANVKLTLSSSPAVALQKGTLSSSGASAVLSVSEQNLSNVLSKSYEWQIRQVSAQAQASGWVPVKDLIGDGIGSATGTQSTLRMTNIDKSLSGSLLRCVVTCTSQAGTPEKYYTDLVTLSLDGEKTKTTLTVAGAENSSDASAGKIEKPYTGTASHNVTKTTDIPKEVTVPETVTDVQNAKTYTVYSYTDTTDTTTNTKSYVGVCGDEYAKVNYDSTAKTYTLGEILAVGTAHKYYENQTKNSYSTDTFTNFDGITTIFKEDTSGGKTITYALMCEVGTGSSIVKEYWYSFDDGFYYEKTSGGGIGEKATTQPETTADIRSVYYEGNGTLILEAAEQQDTSGEDTTGTELPDYGYDHYEVYKQSNGAYALDKTIWRAPDTALYSNDTTTSTKYADKEKLTIVTGTKTETIQETTTTVQAGTALTLNATVTSGGTNVTTLVDYVITNTTTGSETTLTKTAGQPVTWTAPAAGLYRIVATARATVSTQASSADCYYQADTPNTEYRLLVKQGQAQVTDVDYNGNDVTLELQKRDTDNNSTWTAVTEGISYTVAYNVTTEETKNGVTTTTNKREIKGLDSTTYKPTRAVAYDFSAVKTEGTTKTTLASARLVVNKVAITVKPTWDKNETTGNIVPDYNKISLTVTGSNAASREISGAMKVSCSLYDTDGKIKPNAATGVYTVEPVYQTGTATKADVELFQSRYNVTLQTDKIYYFSGSVTVHFEAGENGEVSAWYQDTSGTEFSFPDGSQIRVNYPIKFTASPKDGYTVSQWTVTENDTDINKGYYTANGNTLTFTEAGMKALENKTIKVRVDFANSANKIDYSVGNGSGTLTAKVGNNDLTSNSSVAHNATVKFTAVPADGQMVDHWTIDGAEYKWEGTEDAYRETTLELKNVSASHVVQVFFKEAATTTVHTAVDGLTAGTISVADANGTAIQSEADGTYKVLQSTALVFTANLTADGNNTVKEWKTSTNGKDWTTVEGSGGKTKLTVNQHGETLYVKAVIASAQKFTLDWKIKLQGSDTVPEGVATVTAKANGQEIKNGDALSAYIPVDFALTLNQNYYLVKWEGAEGTGNTAKLSSLDKNTTVIVTIVKKPVISFSPTTATTDAHGSVTANNIPISGGTVPYGSKDNIVFTATPKVGYEVDTWKVKVGDANPIILTSDQITKVANSDNQTYTYTPDATTGITSDVTVEVSFKELDKHTVTFSVVDTNGQTDGGQNGTLTATAERKGMENYKTAYEHFQSESIVYAGSTVTFTAAPDDGYRVKEWQVDGVPYTDARTNTSLTLTPTRDTNVTVQFMEIGSKVTVRAQDNNGSITSVKVENDNVNYTGGFTLMEKAQVVITAEPKQGFVVDQWSINGTPAQTGGNSFTYTAQTADIGADITVSFRQIDYPVSWSTDHGTVTAAGAAIEYTGNSANIRGGTTVTFTATGYDGYTLTGWTVNGKEKQSSNSPTFTWEVENGAAMNPATNAFVVKPVFSRGSYTVTLTQPEHATVRANTDLTRGVTGGTQVTFTAEPAEGYILVGWTVNGTTTNTHDLQHTVTVNSETTVTASIVPSHYNVTYSATGNGSVSAEGFTSSPASVPYGESITFTAVPNGYHHVESWKVNGISQPNTASKNTFTLDNVTANTNVEAVFSGAVQYEVGYKVDGTGGNISAKAGDEPLTLNSTMKANVLGGTKLTFTATPGVDKMVREWKINNKVVEGNLSNTLEINSLNEKTDVTVSFETKQMWTIPNSGTGYKVIEGTKIPDQPSENGKVRDRGTVTFTVAVTGDYSNITNLVINGYDCIADKLAEGSTALINCTSVSVQKNNSGSYTVTVTSVRGNIASNITAQKVFVDERISVPAEFQDNPNLDSVDKIKARLESQLTGSSSSHAFYDITLKYWAGEEQGWQPVIEKNFPQNGVDVTIPYPTGTDSKDTFTLVHLLTSGDVEKPPFKKGESGLEFHVTSLSPFGVSWVKYVAPTPGGGGGGGGGAVSTYTLTFDTNGGSAIDKITKDSGATIDLAAYKPTRAGYTFAGWFSDKALTKAVTSVKLTANTTVYAKWTQNGGTAQNPFVDVKEGAYYYDAVLWAVEKGVTSGTSATTFSPDATVTRGQTVTFLYRNAGSPEVSGTMPFTDVEADAYYAKAVQWAVQQKITTGTSETTFSPMSDCTRGQIVTFLYRAK